MLIPPLRPSHFVVFFILFQHSHATIRRCRRLVNVRRFGVGRTGVARDVHGLLLPLVIGFRSPFLLLLFATLADLDGRSAATLHRLEYCPIRLGCTAKLGGGARVGGGRACVFSLPNPATLTDSASTSRHCKYVPRRHSSAVTRLSSCSSFLLLTDCPPHLAVLLKLEECDQYHHLMQYVERKWELEAELGAC